MHFTLLFHNLNKSVLLTLFKLTFKLGLTLIDYIFYDVASHSLVLRMFIYFY